MKTTQPLKLLPLLLAFIWLSCKKEVSTMPVQKTGTMTKTDPIDTTSILGRWSIIRDSVATYGNYTVDGGIPVTGNIGGGPNDYFEFAANGDFHGVWYNMMYPYPCTYKIVSDSILVTNNVYAPLDSAKIKWTAHTLKITGTNSSATGSILSVFYLKR